MRGWDVRVNKKRVNLLLYYKLNETVIIILHNVGRSHKPLLCRFTYGSDSAVKAASLPQGYDFINKCPLMTRIHFTLMIVFNISVVNICQ